MDKPFARLKNAYAITLDGRLMPGAGCYGVGAVACVMPDQVTAKSWVDEFGEDLAALGRGAAGTVAVGDSWQFMRRAAGEGLAGIEGANGQAFPDRFMFMVRVEEAGAKLPTVLASMTEAGWGACLTRAGVKPLDHADVLHWQRFDILDQVTGQWGERCPFRVWDHGDTLYELRSDSVVVLLATVPLLGDWNSIDGAFAFFTSEDQAIHYHHHHLGDGRNRMLILADSESGDPSEVMASLEPQTVSDLRARLVELADIHPFATWCVNPDGHRENSAYGRFVFGGRTKIGISDQDAEAPRMIAVSGIWKVMPGNVFEIEMPLQPWTGRDTIRWSGGQSIQLLPLDRSFALEPGPGLIEVDEDLTDSEAEELVADYLDTNDSEESWGPMSDGEERSKSRLEMFYLVCWDTVTGEGADYPWTFPGFLVALRHIAAHELEHDRQHRIDGAVSCNHIGFSGSGDAEFEELRSIRFRLGLRRLAVRVLRRGYKPADAEDLVALCNGTLSTLHVDFAGYAKDLLWASSSEQAEELLEALDIEEGEWRTWAISADAAVDARGKELVIARIGEIAWARLSLQVRHFLATALSHLEEQGHAPQLDYAPISVEVVKALEVALAEILEDFRNAAAGKAFIHDTEDSAERALSAFLKGSKAPTLGATSYLLRPPKAEASELRRTLYEYLMRLPNGTFLTSTKFAKQGLQRVINKYRNGGAHDSPIPEDVCRECVDVVIGTLDRPGFVPQVAAWKS